MTVPHRRHEARSPLHDWRVAAMPRSGIAAGVRRHETPFVGRDGLLRLFGRLLGRARDARRLVISLTGEGGIGKTRLLREFGRYGSGSGLEVCWIGDAPACRPPRAPTTPDLPDVTSGGRMLVPEPISAWSPSLRLVMVDLQARPDELPGAVAASLGGDPSVPTVICLAINAAPGRAMPSVHRLLAGLARQRMLHEIDLPPLSGSELFDLTSHILGGTPNARLHQIVSLLSEGNPLFAEEVVWDLQRVGLIRGQHGSWCLLGDIPATYVPAGIATMLSVELDAFDPDLLKTLSSAAVLGPSFQFDVIASALHLPDERVLQHLEVGLAGGILRDAQERGQDFAFSHELVRRMLYRRLGQLRRQTVHQVMAEALERVAGPSEGPEHSVSLAYHLTRGLAPDRALVHVLRAQERAEEDRCWDDAIRYCREGLELARQASPQDVTLQVDLLERLAALYFGQAETFATAACWREAYHLCEQQADGARRAALAARLAALGPSWCSMDDAEAALQAALARADTSEPGQEDAATWIFDAYHELGLAYQRLGRLPKAVEYLQRASAAARPEDWPRCALARVSRASALITAGQPGEAVELLQAALALLDSGSSGRLGHAHRVNHLRDPRRIRCLALGELVRARSYLGQLAEAARLAEAVVDAERQFGMLGGRGQRALAQVELARRRPDRAMAVLGERMRRSAAGSLSAHRVADLLLLAEGHLAGGDPGLALETVNGGIALSRRTGAREHLAALHAVMAQASLARGEIEAALAAVALAHQTIDETGAEAYRGVVLAVEGACQAAARLRPATDGMDAVTSREREVLALMAEGRTNRQIAEVLVLSDKTVKRHLSNMFAKLGVGTRAAAVRCAFRSGML